MQSPENSTLSTSVQGPTAPQPSSTERTTTYDQLQAKDALVHNLPMPTGKARFDAHKAHYDALNKIYGTYFSAGKAPSRACMAVEWIPGDSLIEIVGSALVVSPASGG